MPAAGRSRSGALSSGSASSVPGRIVTPGRASTVTATGSSSSARRVSSMRSTVVPSVPVSTHAHAPSASTTSATPGT